MIPPAAVWRVIERTRIETKDIDPAGERSTGRSSGYGRPRRFIGAG